MKENGDEGKLGTFDIFLTVKFDLAKQKFTLIREHSCEVSCKRRYLGSFNIVY